MKHSGGKHRSALSSPAACLLPQFREKEARRRRLRLRRVDENATVGSPGAFYTYFSAGAFLLPEEERRRRRVAARSPKVAILFAALLLAIWIAFR